MAPEEVQARHVFHVPTTGWDRALAWQEATGEPVFSWGRFSGATDGLTFGTVKKAFRKWVEQTATRCQLTIFHDGCSADLLGMLDPCEHRILFMHRWTPRWERDFDWAIRCTGKAIFGDPSQEEIIQKHFGWIPDRFLRSIHQPLMQGKAAQAATGEGPRARTGIWMHGRRWRLNGNRLRAIVDRWKPENGQLEIICSGAGRPAWSKSPFLIWSADLPLEFAFYRLFTWDSVLLLDNFSLDSPWLLRALSLNCFPLVPDGDNPGITPQWKSESAPRTYEWGDIPAAHELLRQWRRRREKVLPQYKEWREELLRPHLDAGAILEQWGSLKDHFLNQKVSRIRKRKAYPSWYPLTFLERLQRLRSGA